jgi:hypothetical protein
MKFKLFDSEDFGVTSQPASESVDSAGISLRQVPADMLVTSTPTSQCNESVTAVACAKCQWPQRSAGTAVPVCLVVTTSTVTAKTKTTLALAVAL